MTTLISTTAARLGSDRKDEPSGAEIAATADQQACTERTMACQRQAGGGTDADTEVTHSAARSQVPRCRSHKASAHLTSGHCQASGTTCALLGTLRKLKAHLEVGAAKPEVRHELAEALLRLLRQRPVALRGAATRASARAQSPRPLAASPDCPPPACRTASGPVCSSCHCASSMRGFGPYLEMYDVCACERMPRRASPSCCPPPVEAHATEEYSSALIPALMIITDCMHDYSCLRIACTMCTRTCNTSSEASHTDILQACAYLDAADVARKAAARELLALVRA